MNAQNHEYCKGPHEMSTVFKIMIISLDSLSPHLLIIPTDHSFCAQYLGICKIGFIVLKFLLKRKTNNAFPTNALRRLYAKMYQEDDIGAHGTASNKLAHGSDRQDSNISLVYQYFRSQMELQKQFMKIVNRFILQLNNWTLNILNTSIDSLLLQ